MGARPLEEAAERSGLGDQPRGAEGRLCGPAAEPLDFEGALVQLEEERLISPGDGGGERLAQRAPVFGAGFPRSEARDERRGGLGGRHARAP